MVNILNELTYEELLMAHNDFNELHATGILKENTIGRMVFEKSKEFYSSYAVPNMIIHSIIMEEILRRQKDRTCKNCGLHARYGCPIRHTTGDYGYCSEFKLDKEKI